MRNHTLSLLVLTAALFIGATRMHLLAGPNDKTPRQSLQEARETNQKIIDQQTATLQKLDDLKTLSDQLRAFSKRG